MAPPRTPSSSYPLYGTTFSLHTLSPLHHPPSPTPFLSPPTLLLHARRFHDLLRGEVLRGVRVALDDESSVLTRAGALLAVTFSVLPIPPTYRALRAFSASLDAHDDDADSEADEEALREREAQMTEEEKAGVLIEVTYENNVYTAVLLRDGPAPAPAAGAETSFTLLPLLLVRMPTPLRDTLLDYLRSTFDTHIASMSLSSQWLGTALEDYLAQVAESGGEYDEDGGGGVEKDVQISLSFEAEGLVKGLDLSLSKDDVMGFVRRGKEMQGRASRGFVKAEEKRGPFLLAIERYLKENLALGLGRKEVRISRVGCGAFVVGGEGKVKIFAPSRESTEDDPSTVAVHGFVKALVRRAEGRGALGGTRRDE